MKNTLNILIVFLLISCSKEKNKLSNTHYYDVRKETKDLSSGKWLKEYLEEKLQKVISTSDLNQYNWDSVKSKINIRGQNSEREYEICKFGSEAKIIYLNTGFMELVQINGLIFEISKLPHEKKTN